jgi:hypothetical protein
VQLQPLPHYQDAIPLHIPEPFDYIPESIDHVIEDADQEATGQGDMDMQGPFMLHIPSPDSDGLPFYPKYLNSEGHEVMSPGEFRAWLYNDPHAPPLYRSQPTSAGSTWPISPSAPDNSVAPICRWLSAEGQYQMVTHQVTPEVTTTSSRERSPCSPLGTLMLFTPIFTQVPIPRSEPTIGTLGGGFPKKAAPPGGHHEPPYQPTAEPSRMLEP